MAGNSINFRTVDDHCAIIVAYLMSRLVYAKRCRCIGLLAARQVRAKNSACCFGWWRAIIGDLLYEKVFILKIYKKSARDGNTSGVTPGIVVGLTLEQAFFVREAARNRRETYRTRQCRRF